jgi:hypothetical protein
LKPTDFDWKQSRPKTQWLTTFGRSIDDEAPRIDNEPEPRTILLLELRTLDVEQVFEREQPAPGTVRPIEVREAAPSTRKPSHFNEKNSMQFAKNFIASEQKAGRQPTQVRLEKAAQDAGYVGGRETFLRPAFTKLWQNKKVGRPSHKFAK